MSVVGILTFDHRADKLNTGLVAAMRACGCRFAAWKGVECPNVHGEGARLGDLGLVLRTAREQRDLTIADVSRETRIQEPFLEALERGDYAQIPGPVYVAGFLRNYARVVGLQPDDIVQEYYALRPMPQPTVKAATRVLANGYRRDYRRRVLWGLGGLVVAMGGAFTVKQYSDQYAHASSTSPLNVTPANTGAVVAAPASHPALPRHTGTARVQLRSTAPVLVQVTVDGRRVFDGLLRGGTGMHAWSGRTSVKVLAYNGHLVRASFNGHSVGVLSRAAGPVTESVTTSGWKRVS